MDTFLSARAVLVSAAVGALVVAFLRRKTDDVHDVPGPSSGSWLYGHEYEIYEKEVGVAYNGWFSQFGSMVRIRAAFGHKDILVVADNVAAHHILQDYYNFVKSPVFRPFISKAARKGLAWAEGDEHKALRKLLNPALSNESVRKTTPMVYDAATKAQTKLAQLVSSNGGSTIVEIHPWTSGVILEIIGRFAFDHDFTQGDQTQRVQEVSAKHGKLFNSKGNFISARVIRALPFITALPIKALHTDSPFKIMVKNWAREELLKEDEGMNEGGQKSDVLSLLKKAHQEGALTMDQLLDNIVTFIIGGQETAAALVDLVIYELSRNPDKQRKLRQELSAIGSKEPTFDDYNTATKYPYLDAVVRETLRMYPSLPYIERIALKDSVIPLRTPIITPSGHSLSQIRVSAGQIITIPLISSHVLTSTWGLDAKEWNPERWLPPNELPASNLLPQGWGNLYAFSDGPRNCIGYRLAVFEVKVLLTTFIRNFMFENVGAKPTLRAAPTIKPFVGDEESLKFKVSLAFG